MMPPTLGQPSPQPCPTLPGRGQCQGPRILARSSAMALMAPCGVRPAQGLQRAPAREPSRGRPARAGLQQAHVQNASLGAGSAAAERPLAPSEPGPQLQLVSRRSAMRFALGCGCAAAVQPLILRPASAVVLSPLMPEPKTTWSDSGFANEMASGMSDYERFLSPLKAALFADVAGSVLELGCGTGPSLRYYGAARSVVGVEPNLAMHPLAISSADAAGLGDRFSIVTGNAEALPFEDASFDTVVGASRLHDSTRGAASCARSARADALPMLRRYLRWYRRDHGAVLRAGRRGIAARGAPRAAPRRQAAVHRARGRAGRHAASSDAGAALH